MKSIISSLALLFGVVSHVVADEEYTLTNITGWTSSQLSSLPHFDRYAPIQPAGATTDFTSVCSNGLGLLAGNRSDANGDHGAFVVAGNQTDISAWGKWYWSYWFWDGQDNHYVSGSVERSPVSAVNVLGQVLGYANFGGVSSAFATRNDWDDHIYLFDSETGAKLDLTPTAHRSASADLNDRGEVIGYWSDDNSYHPFRRSSDGAFTDFIYDSHLSHTISPAVINNRGHVAGLITLWTISRDYIPFFSEAGNATEELPYPDNKNAYKASVADINDHDVIVGYYHKTDAPLETTALRWTKRSGEWVAEELEELLTDNLDFILDRAIAVNDAGYIICSGHADGGPDNSWNTHQFLLTPLNFPAPAVTTLEPKNITSNGATLRMKVNAANLPTIGKFDYGTSTDYGANSAIAEISGAYPNVVERELNDLSPHTTYYYRSAATNSAGSTDTVTESFTTAWNWASWADNQLGGSIDPNSDNNNNGSPDGIDYATGNKPSLFGVVVNGQLQVTFHRLTAAEGVTLVVQVSSDLLTWVDGASYSYSSSTPNTAISSEISRSSDGLEAEWITVGLDTSRSLRFVRLKAVMQ